MWCVVVWLNVWLNRIEYGCVWLNVVECVVECGCVWFSGLNVWLNVVCG